MDKLDLAPIRLAHMTPAQRDALGQRMQRAGSAAGIQFKWGGKIGPGTRQAHRLIRLAAAHKDASVQDAVVEGLFDAYHARERDVSERDVLRDIGVAAGIDGAETDTWLDSDADADVVDAEAAMNKEMLKGSGVPEFVVQGTHRLNGVQDPADLLELFIRVREGG